MWMLPVATAIQRDAQKINVCVLCVRVLCKTRRSFIRSFSRLSYLRTGVKGYSKIRCVLAKSPLILDEMCRLYGKFASYLRRVLCKTRLIFPRINGPIMDQRKVYISLHFFQLQCTFTNFFLLQLYKFMFVFVVSTRENVVMLWIHKKAKWNKTRNNFIKKYFVSISTWPYLS